MKKLKYILCFLIVVGSLFAADEIHVDYPTGDTLYAARFQPAGNVFVTNGSSDEAWSTAADYDVTMTENGSGGHYVGSFDADAAIGDGTYKITVYQQLAGAPANSDPAIYVGTIVWKDGAEFDPAAVLISIETLAQEMLDWMEADEFIDDSNPSQFQIVTTKKQSGGGGAELGRKNYFDIDGNPIINLRKVFAETQEP